MSITKPQIIQAANTLLAEGVQPTVLKVREQLGGGAAATINAVLREWRHTALAETSDSGAPPAKIRDLFESFNDRLWQALHLQTTEQIEALRKQALAAIGQAELDQEELATLLDKLGEEHRQHGEQATALQKQLTTVTKTIQHSEHEAQLANTKAQTIAAERDRLLAQVQELGKKHDLLAHDYVKLNDEWGKLKAQYELEKAAHVQTRQGREQVETRLKDAVRARDDDVQARKKDEARSSRAEKEREELSQTANRATEENVQLKHKFAAIERQLATLTREYNHATQEANVAVAKAEAIGSERDRLLGQIKGLGQKADALEHSQQKLLDELSKHKSQLELEKNNHQQAKQHRDTLEAQVRETHRRLEELAKIQLGTENRANRMEDDAAKYRDKHEQLLQLLENERVKWQQRIEDERHARVEAGRVASELRVRIAQAEADTQKLALHSQQEIAHLQKTVDQLEMALEEARANAKSERASGAPLPKKSVGF
ncbi:MAG: DNA-binding protein [Gammaproteobacteria bacterium]